MDENAFTPRPMVSFSSGRKLSSYLARAKLYPTEKLVRSLKCNKPRCLVSDRTVERERELEREQ